MKREVEKHTVEIWLSIDSEANAAVSTESGDDARERLTDEHGICGDIRTVRVLAAITLPQVIEANVDIPDDAGRADVEAA